jgi:hypothetical protein
MGAFLLHQVDALKPHHEALSIPQRVYVSLHCVHSKHALETLRQFRGEADLLIIPVDLEASDERTRICQDALPRIRREAGVLWHIVPDSFLCQRLAEEARDWLAGFDGKAQVPAWTLDGDLSEFGWAPENVLHLQERGLLRHDAEPTYANVTVEPTPLLGEQFE